MSFDHARKCVNHYRRLGLCPLPSRMEKPKGPMLPSYAEFYKGEPVPESVYSGWRTSNIQIITGTRTPTMNKILVVDCDGEEAHCAWRLAKNRHGIDGPMPTWVSRTGGGGWHYWFRIPAGATPVPSGLIWGLWDTWGDDGKGKWAKHKEVRILADNALVIAPPSIHVETGKAYEFIQGRSPRDYPLPAEAPTWLLEMPRLVAPRCHEPKPVEKRPFAKSSGNHYSRDEVLAAVGVNKLDIATREWGLKAASSGPNANGWVSCFVPWREDPTRSQPSGSFHFEDGTFQDRKDLTTIPFFDLGVALGRFSTWQECRDHLGDRFLGGFRNINTRQFRA